ALATRRATAPTPCGFPAGQTIRSRRSCMTAAGPWTVASQVPGGCADVKRMIVGRVAQRDFVMTNGFRDVLQRVMQFHRLRVPPVHHIPETRRRQSTPYRWRYCAHATDE